MQTDHYIIYRNFWTLGLWKTHGLSIAKSQMFVQAP
jgi:hypothetical protein